MTDATYQDRQEFEMEHWPELREAWNNVIQLVFPAREVSGELKQLVFTVASLASGCRHCQSHGAYHLHKIETILVQTHEENMHKRLFLIAMIPT